jgi:hypothetical protein
MSLIKEFWQYSAVDYVFMHINAVFRLGLGSGYNLRALLVEIEKCGELYIDYNQLQLRRRQAPIHQLILNLMQPKSFRSQLIGEIMDEDDCRDEWSSDAPSLFVLDLMSLVAACYFNDYERALEPLERMNSGDTFKSFSPDCWVPLRIFYSGLVWATLSAQKKYRNQRKLADSQLLQLRIWAVQGNVTCHHMYLILEAQLMRSRYPSRGVDIKSVVSLFTEASQSAAQVYMTHHQAMAHELAARFLKETSTAATTATVTRGLRFSRRNNNHMKQESSPRPTSPLSSSVWQHHLDCAIELYTIWGATAKVNQLLEDFQDVHDPLPGQNGSSTTDVRKSCYF